MTVEKRPAFELPAALIRPQPVAPTMHRPVATAFGVKRGLLGKFMPVKRTTFVIDTDRRVLDVIASEISMDSHADKALEVLRGRRV